GRMCGTGSTSPNPQVGIWVARERVVKSFSKYRFTRLSKVSVRVLICRFSNLTSALSRATQFSFLRNENCAARATHAVLLHFEFAPTCCFGSRPTDVETPAA